jgi:hypothetical protein
MSDEFDDTLQGYGEEIAHLYDHLVTVCRSLPVAPIQLPTGAPDRPVDLAGECLDAVRRAADIADELPVPEELGTEIYAACIYWASAIDIFGLLVREPEINRGPEVDAQILNCQQAVRSAAELLGE